MIEVKSDNKESQKCIEAIIKKVEACGGILNAPMTLSCMNGYLSILAPKNSHQGPIIALPEEALPPIDKFSLKLKGDDLYVDSHEDVDDNRVEIMNLMMELYNLTGKIKDFRHTSPWIFLNRHPDLADYILVGRNGPSTKKYLYKKNFDHDDEIITTFIKSRQLGFKSDNHSNKKIHVIMPVIDFLNHDANSSSFQGIPDEQGKNKLGVSASHPLEGSEEIFVSYGSYDALDTIINYGYPDKTAQFTRSVGLTINLENVGILVINSQSGAKSSTQLPPQMADLKFFMPRILSQEKEYLEISHLYIPGPKAPRSLRRILTYLISTQASGLTQFQISKLVLYAEHAIIEKNLEYYAGLEKKIESLPEEEQNRAVASMLKETAQIQTAKIHTYDNIRKSLATT